eukprot:1996028-Rhodomonas_salina.1
MEACSRSRQLTATASIGPGTSGTDAVAPITLCRTGLGTRYSEPGTDVVYCFLTAVVYCFLKPYAVLVRIALGTRYAVPGTESRYGATRKHSGSDRGVVRGRREAEEGREGGREGEEGGREGGGQGGMGRRDGHDPPVGTRWRGRTYAGTAARLWSYALPTCCPVLT